MAMMPMAAHDRLNAVGCSGHDWELEENLFLMV